MIPKDANFDYILTAGRRQFWFIVIPFFLIFMAAIIYCIAAPRAYRSSSLVLVQPQEVPAEYVKSTVTSDVKSRLNSITDEVLSRSALEEIITKFDLYPELRSRGRMHDAIETLRKKITVNVKEAGTAWNKAPSSFDISFEGPEPRTVRDVTASLANLYIDHNFRLRAEQAAGTLKFLDHELERMREELRQKEELVRQFKERHLGLLPEQMENNSRILTQLQQHLDSVNKSLQAAEDRKILLQTQSTRLRALQPGTPGAGRDEDLPTSVEGLRQELQRLQTRYSDQHPDVLRLKRLLEKAEKGEQVTGGQLNARGSADTKSSDTQRLISAEREDVSVQLKLIDKEVASLRQETEKTQAQIGDYRHRIENGPKIEQMFLDLRRDYQQASDNYQSLLQKKLQAEMAENLERTQKGEQFKILDQANLPQEPYKPDLRKMLSLGLVAALGCGFGLAFYREYRDPSFWARKEVESALELPVLITIPVITTERDLQKRKAKMAGTAFLLLFMGSVLLVALFVLWKRSPSLLRLPL
jgi:polysaccharide chain length determinant protein (PEP-CTERM system associated)